MYIRATLCSRFDFVDKSGDITFLNKLESVGLELYIKQPTAKVVRDIVLVFMIKCSATRIEKYHWISRFLASCVAYMCAIAQCFAESSLPWVIASNMLLVFCSRKPHGTCLPACTSTHHICVNSFHCWVARSDATVEVIIQTVKDVHWSTGVDLYKRPQLYFSVAKPILKSIVLFQ